MKQSDLIQKVSMATNLPKSAIEDVLKSAAETVIQALAEGDHAPLIGLGKITVEKRAARHGRNPRTGEKVKIPAKTVAKFRASGELKAALPAG